MKFVQISGDNKYFITFVNDSTKYCCLYLLKNKDKTIEKFALYKKEFDNQLNKRIKVLRSDRDGEYDTPFGQFCTQHEIIHEVMTSYSPIKWYC